jgi:two-component system response regulator RegA
MKVLLADDDRTFVDLISTRLRAKGFDVAVAFDATQAMMIAVKLVPDAIVLDIRMPGGNGIDTLRRIRSSTRTGLTKVIVVSGSEEKGVEKTALDNGAAAFIRKPAKFDDVYGALREALALPPEGDAAG